MITFTRKDFFCEVLVFTLDHSINGQTWKRHVFFLWDLFHQQLQGTIFLMVGLTGKCSERIYLGCYEHKDPYWTTSIMESKSWFFSWLTYLELTSGRWKYHVTQGALPATSRDFTHWNPPAIYSMHFWCHLTRGASCVPPGNSEPPRFEYDDRTRKVKASQKVLNAMRKAEVGGYFFLFRRWSFGLVVWAGLVGGSRIQLNK